MRCDHCYLPGATVYYRPLWRRLARRPPVVRYLCHGHVRSLLP